MTPPAPAPERLSVPSALLQRVADYLSARPYREVAPLLAELQRDVQPVTAAPEAPTNGASADPQAVTARMRHAAAKAGLKKAAAPEAPPAD
jgi:hypothetical protein